MITAGPPDVQGAPMRSSDGGVRCRALRCVFFGVVVVVIVTMTSAGGRTAKLIIQRSGSTPKKRAPWHFLGTKILSV
jgi:hypothetical protein